MLAGARGRKHDGLVHDTYLKTCIMGNGVFEEKRQQPSIESTVGTYNTLVGRGRG